MHKRGLVTILLVAGLFVAASPAWADSIDFSIAGQGTWSFPGTVGSTLSTPTPGPGNIQVKQTSPVPGLNSTLTGSHFTFTSGTLASIVPGVYTFNPGGSLTISNTTAADCAGNCLAGNFTGGQLAFNQSLGNWTFTGLFITANVDPYVWGLVGLAGTPTTAVGTVTVVLQGDPSASTTGTFGSADMGLTRSAVPEPATLSLFGTGLISLAGLLRRKLRP